ncbi:MAG: Ribose-5-phosphate isomerase B [Syntrophus sp. SKADARSKE-3]|nr:Ribose-5-phosphate isomerase B [Syntrophus sp. SKADARSKE-3]
MDRIVIGSDHAGFTLKEAVKHYLETKGFRVDDIGTANAESVDYPDFGCRVAEKVSAGEFQRGVLVCGSGVGMAIVANKFPRIRAVLSMDEETARMSRLHNDSNILVLAGRRTDIATASRIADTWLSTAFEGGRHQTRLDKITELESRLCRPS